MVTKILVALQNTVQKHPDSIQRGVGVARNAINWLNRQPFGGEVKDFVRGISFTVNLGSFPELNTQRYSITKNAGDFNLYGSTERNDRFTITVDGLIRSMNKMATSKQNVASERASEAKRRADEAKRLAAEAQRLADEAETMATAAANEAKTFANAVSSLSGTRW